MDCALVEIELVPYHLGLGNEELQARIDEHLLHCQSCLRTYFRLKRHWSTRSAERPSEHARTRLRNAVAAEFRPSIVARLSGQLRRPIPLYQGLAAAGVLGLLLSALGPIVAARGTKPQPRNGPEVDTARPVAAHLNVY